MGITLDRRELKKFHNGDIQLFQSLYEQLWHRIYHYCYRILGDRDLAKDASQETFLKAYERRQQLRTGAVRSWIFLIARNTCYNLIRDAKETEPLPEHFQADFGFNPEDGDFLLRDLLDKLLQKMPLKYREPLVLRDIEDLSYAEIGQIVGISEENARIRVYRARSWLREQLHPIIEKIQ